MRKPFNGEYPISQVFGNVLILEGVNVYAQWGMRGHNGIDYAMPTGTTIVAPHAGRVVEASFDANGYGNYIKIESATEGSVLAHLQDIKVSVGFELKEGDEVGTSNNSGKSTGPHLHWGYYKIPRDRGNGYLGYIDQEPFLAQYTVPVSGRMYSEIEYNSVLDDRNKFWKERDEQIAIVATKTQQLIDLAASLSAFKAEGINSVEDIRNLLAPVKEMSARGFNNYGDIEKEMKTKNEQIEGLNRELVQVLDRNKVLLDQLAKKEDEDYTAIQAGVKALDELKQLKENMAKVHGTLGISQSKGFDGLEKLISSIKELKFWAKKASDKVATEAATPITPVGLIDPIVEGDTVLVDIPVVEPITPKQETKPSNNWAWFAKLLSNYY